MEKYKKIILPICLILLILIGCYSLYYFENYEEICYCIIDNTKIEKLSSNDDMKYEYSLICYKENGKKKNIKFKTVRELRNEAYILLELRLTGVHSWKEVKFDELPSKVKEKISK